MSRHDMLVELASDKVNLVKEMVRELEYRDLHHWLQPIFLEQLKYEFGDLSDDDLKHYYCDQMGVDIPEDPPLSSTDAEEEIHSQAEEAEIGLAAEKAKLGSMPDASGVDHFALSLLHPIRYATRLGEMAPKSPVPTTVEASLPWY
jgi:hypothetical protein